MDYSFSKSLPHHIKQMILIIGSFDGIHLGHYELFKKAYQYKSVKPDFEIATISFTSSIAGFFQQKHIPSIFNLTERQIILNSLSIDHSFFIQPSQDFFDLSAKSFLELLLQHNGEIHLIVSERSRFGKDQAGATELKAIALELGNQFSLEVVPLRVSENQEKIASSLIREYVENGDIEKATDLLFNPYFIYGPIVKGDQNGRTVGYPTINIPFPENKILPQFGVYRSETNIKGLYLPSLTYISNFKLQKNSDRVISETWVPSYKAEEGEEEFYGASTSINLIKFIRPPAKINNLEELKTWVEKDKLTLNET